MLGLNIVNSSVFSSCRCAAKSNIFCQIKIRNFVSEKVEVAEKKVDKREAMMQELKDNFEPIYRFPQASGLSAISRIKNYQGVATVICIPASYFIFPENFFEVAYTGVTLFFALSLASYILSNSIGAVYLHKNNHELVRIAFIDFWGRRQDSEININDIIPFDLQKKQSISDRIFSKVKFNNNKHIELKFISKNAVVLDNGKFSQVFGEY